MESIFLYLILGISIYLVNLATQKSRKTFKLLAFLEAGFIVGLILGFITDFPLTPHIRLPWLALAFLGLFAGLILYIAETINFFNLTGLQYFSTILLGLIHAGIYFLFMKLYIILSTTGLTEAKPITLQPLIFLLLSFIIFFGYTFPRRWITREKTKKKENA